VWSPDHASYQLSSLAPSTIADPTDNLASQPIALSVVRIELYGHDMDELGQGLTGCLTLEGDGHNRLSDGGRIGA